MELEADAEGAQIMHKSGYDADALLSVIGAQRSGALPKSSGKSGGQTFGHLSWTLRQSPAQRPSPADSHQNS